MRELYPKIQTIQLKHGTTQIQRIIENSRINTTLKCWLCGTEENLYDISVCPTQYNVCTGGIFCKECAEDIFRVEVEE